MSDFRDFGESVGRGQKLGCEIQPPLYHVDILPPVLSLENYGLSLRELEVSFIMCWMNWFV